MLSTDELIRYSRHILLPEVGLEGQERLRDASVLIVGAGGLGAPLIQYLAAAGIGRLGIVENDVIEISNLQRQVIHGSDDVGASKLDSAIRQVSRINPHVEVVPFPRRLAADNALSVLAGFDVVVDATDNFPTRYLINDAAVLAGIPNVYASIYRFEGQVAVWGTPGGPCYRCLFPAPPPPELAPSCAEGGVLGTLAGFVGSLQANEVLKQILGVGELLAGRILQVDALRMTFETMQVPRDPQCPVCGDSPSIRQLIDYEAFCGEDGEEPLEGRTPCVTATELAGALKSESPPLLLDVREPGEAHIATLGGIEIPLRELPHRLAELGAPGDAPIVVYCRTGRRSADAVRRLAVEGYSGARNLDGGLASWSTDIDSSMPRY